MPYLDEKDLLFNVTFMQDGKTTQIVTPVNEFLTQTFGEDRDINMCGKFQWPPRSFD